MEQRSARHPVTVEVVGSNPIRVALDKQHEIRYNRHMAKIEEGRTLWDIYADERVGHCNRCEQGDHGIESKYRAGHCACCGTEVEYA